MTPEPPSRSVRTRAEELSSLRPMPCAMICTTAGLTCSTRRWTDWLNQRSVGCPAFCAGKLKAKRDWQLSAFYQHVEQFALDPNLVDSDIFDSRVNMEGFVVQAGYAISDAVFFNLTYGYGEQIDGDLGTGGVGDAFSLNPLHKYSIFQSDLSVKF